MQRWLFPVIFHRKETSVPPGRVKTLKWTVIDDHSPKQNEINKETTVYKPVDGYGMAEGVIYEPRRGGRCNYRGDRIME